jgi:hypothetical protein
VLGLVSIAEQPQNWIVWAAISFALSAIGFITSFQVRKQKRDNPVLSSELLDSGRIHPVLNALRETHAADARKTRV